MSQKNENTVNASESNKNNSTTSNQNCSKIRSFPLICGIILFLYEIANIILYFAIIHNKTKEVGGKNTVLLAFHSLFHLSILFLAFSLFFSAFKRKFLTSLLSSIFLLLAFVFYMSYSGVFFVETKDPKNQITLEKLQNTLRNSPIQNAFFYSKGLVESKNFTANPTTGQPTMTDTLVKCYSNSSIVLPLNSKQINE